MVNPMVVLNMKRDFYLDVYTIKSDLINNMDHMRISGNEPSVNLSQAKGFQTLKMIARKCQIKLKPKGMV